MQLLILSDCFCAIIEGGLTMVMAVVAWFWLPWSPVQTTGGFWRKPWLTERQQKIMVNRYVPAIEH